MLKERDRFMLEAGDLSKELKEIEQSENNNVLAPATTENTPFFTIYCC